MKRQLYLNDKDTERFYEILNQKKQLIIKALYKVHIPSKLHHEFYNYGLEGLLISFLILNEGKISEQDFDRFAFTTIKRKLIDEIRYRNKDKSIPLDIVNVNLNMSKKFKIKMYILFICLLEKIFKSIRISSYFSYM